MKEIRFFLLLCVVALGILGLVGCPNDTVAGGGGGGGAPTSELTITIDGAAARTYTIGSAAYLPDGSDSTNFPSVALNTTRLVAVTGDLTDMLILDCIDTNIAGVSDAGSSEIQLMLNIDGGPSLGGKGFLIIGAVAGTGTVTITAYGAVGGQVVGSFNLIAPEVNAAMTPTGGTAELIGTFDLYHKANQAVDE